MRGCYHTHKAWIQCLPRQLAGVSFCCTACTADAALFRLDCRLGGPAGVGVLTEGGEVNPVFFFKLSCFLIEVADARDFLVALTGVITLETKAFKEEVRRMVAGREEDSPTWPACNNRHQQL